MATLKTKRAFKIAVRELLKKDPATMGQILLEAGYSKSTSICPGIVTNSKGWKEQLARIDNDPLLRRLRELSMCDDKRVSLEGIKTILIDLKGLGADKTTKVVGLFGDLEQLRNDNKSTTITEEDRLPASQGTDGSFEVSK